MIPTCTARRTIMRRASCRLMRFGDRDPPRVRNRGEVLSAPMPAAVTYGVSEKRSASRSRGRPGVAVGIGIEGKLEERGVPIRGIDRGGGGELELLDRVAGSGAMVPALWRLEVANAFQSAIRRQRIW